MNTKFNILWFEDRDWYDIASKEISDYLEEKNFNTNFKRFKTVDEAQIKNVRTIPFDIIFVDYDLTNNTTGNNAIKLLREDHPLADVLFYSNSGVHELQAAMKADVLEGVYTSTRQGRLFFDKAIALIDKLIMRSEDILNIRGLLMDSVSEFDDKIKEAIEKHLSISSPEERKIVNDYVLDKIISQSKDRIKKCEQMQSDNAYIEAKKRYYIDSYKLSQLISDIFKRNYSTVEEMVDFHEKYDAEILKERNHLAHAKKIPEADGAAYFENKDGETITYDSEKCSALRANIIFYNELISRIVEYIE